MHLLHMLQSRTHLAAMHSWHPSPLAEPPPSRCPQVLDQLGFQPKEAFPVYSDRMPNQLLAYLRLARLQDPALFAKVGAGAGGGSAGWLCMDGCMCHV